MEDAPAIMASKGDDMVSRIEIFSRGETICKTPRDTIAIDLPRRLIMLHRAYENAWPIAACENMRR